jgi:hypothetical protein
VENQKLPLIAAGVVLALSAGGWLFMRRANVPAPAAQEAPASTPAATPMAARVPQEAPISLPGLDDSDAYAAGRARSLFSQAVPPQWLGADGLIRRLTAAAAIVAEGDSPRDSLSFLKPRGKFKVRKAKGRVYVDPASYARYDAVGDAAEALDAAAAARFINEARPLFQQACAELNDKSCDFRAAVLRSAKQLLKTPVVQGDVRLHEKVVTWMFADPALEGLSAAQKHLLRLGPRNEAKVQAKLRALALALGASEADLPAPQSYTPRD